MANDVEVVPSDNEVTTEPTGESPKPKKTKTGGRQKGTPNASTAKRWSARALAEKFKFHGLAELIEVYQSGKLPIIEGQKIAQTASPAQRLRALEQAALYLWPRLSSQEISGKDGGPIQSQHAELNLDVILADPNLVAAAQTLSIAMTNQSRPAPLQLEAAPEDQ